MIFTWNKYFSLGICIYISCLFTIIKTIPPLKTNLTKHRRASCSPELHTLRDDLLTHFLLPGENLPNGLQWPPYSFRWHAYNYDYTYVCTAFKSLQSLLTGLDIKRWIELYFEIWINPYQVWNTFDKNVDTTSLGSMLSLKVSW